jgi:hypothetical protein
MQKLLLLLSALMITTSSYAEISGSIGVDFSENASDNVIATKDIDLNISSDVGFASIAVITNSSDQLVLDEYALGVKYTEGSISYGEQSDIFIGGGLEVVGADTLANPSDAGESIIGSYKNTSVRFKFTDTGTDVTDFDTVQLKHTLNIGKVDVAGSVDHTIATDDNIYAIEAGLNIAPEVALTTVATHDNSLTDKVAYESIITTKGVSLFVNGDEGDWSQNVGAGYISSYKSVDWYVEAGYNMDSEDVTPAAGVSVNF